MTEGVIQALTPWRLPIERVLRATIVAAALIAAGAAAAKTTGVDDDPQLQSGPCYEALVDKNESNPTTAPKRELGAACQAEDGDIDKAWARVVRLWGSDSTDLPDYGSYVRADAPVGGAAPKWLAAIGILLTYAVLGAPIRSAARLFGAYPGPARGAAIGAVVSLILRGLVCAAFVALFGLPYVGALGAAALIAWTIVRLSRAPAAPLEPDRRLVRRASGRNDQRRPGRLSPARRPGAFRPTELAFARDCARAGARGVGGPRSSSRGAYCGRRRCAPPSRPPRSSPRSANCWLSRRRSRAGSAA